MATTRSWPPAPTAARCCTRGCARAQRRASAGPSASCASSCSGCADWGATGPLLVRADSGFWSKKTIAALERHGVRYSIGVSQQESVRRAIERIPEQDWQPLADYPAEGIAEIAEGSLSGRRLVVRRTRLVGAQAELFPDWRHHAFITDRAEPLAQVEADHRRHAQIELAIRDLKEGSGLNHAPSGRFFANAAWLLISALAHNLARWIAHLGLALRGPIVAQTIRRRYLTLPGRITRSARRFGPTCVGKACGTAGSGNAARPFIGDVMTVTSVGMSARTAFAKWTFSS